MQRTPEPSAGSLWLATAHETAYPRLEGDLAVDTVIVGGGIAGLTAALALKRRGLTVAVLEAARVATGVTGNTTGKVTSLHRLAYTSLAADHGLETARAYGRANQAAIEHIARTAAEERIACGFRRVANYTYAETAEGREAVMAEAELAASLGLPASFTTDVPLPYATTGAVRFDGQAQLNAVAYVQGMARAVDGDGSFVFERTRVGAVRDGSPAEVASDGGTVRALDVVLATNVPIEDGGRFDERLYLHRSYIVASPVRDFPEGSTFISVEEPMRSMLGVRADRVQYALVGGEGHRVGGETGSAERFERLGAFARDRLGADAPTYRWSTQDAMPADGLPFAGPMSPDSRHVYVVTGLRKWGLTNGTAGALVVADLITGADSPGAGVFDSTRTVHAKLAPPSSAEAEAAESTAPEDLRPGQGTVVDDDGKPTAVYREDDGSLRALTAACTHLGCTVEFNASARTWDCPCHGSRFALDGSVIHGPAERPLSSRAVPAPHT
ncbi:FAD-dependent oxidoreductase [Sinomonas sp. JGH33]|uniref:FAD-dependent oxidoreductase n=1 Tax=Sinomonas terricola TaxID=3110330 RepID=A0ABU5TA65_9MICC|nr:FAD-dependent oxidoreductase [Sinomonas sp. JGH33]MEA5456006.1 FAD-dependent oxidoreductase [Sinomonas sp. JGH33]